MKKLLTFLASILLASPAWGLAVGTWDNAFEGTPANGDLVSEGDDRIRELKNSVRNYADVEHYWSDITSPDDNGFHRQGSAYLLTDANCLIVAPGDHDDGWLCYDTVKDALFVLVGGAWEPVSGVPPGTVVIFDHADTCPNGYTEYEEFEGVTLRGRDILPGDDVNIPDDANVTCTGDGGVEVGAGGCGPLVEAGRYADIITETQLPSHDHDLEALIVNAGAGAWSSTAPPPGGTTTTATGDDDPHYHPFRTVLFCEKD